VDSHTVTIKINIF